MGHTTHIKRMISRQNNGKKITGPVTVIITCQEFEPVDVCGDSAGDNPAVVASSRSLAFTQRMVWLSKILLLTKIKNRNKDGGW